ncbi:MAG: 50S ribosomal protein L3 [Candidatus Peribacteraceae bacterium]|nr:50S ribosomal protein L3 [Candidatus Peribacteraceae bacterium]
MTGLIATKAGMSRIFQENGESVAVTYLEVEPNTVVRTKTEEKDGYNALVLGVGPKKWKTRKGNEHTKYSIQKEWRVDTLEDVKAGSTITAAQIPVESTVTITGTSKGKGFQGVIKRHKFSRGPETHGSHHHRKPGSIGMKEYPGRVLKGKKMPGRMGGDTITLKNRPVIISDEKKGVIAVKGPIPGPNGSRVFITVETLSDTSSSAS